MSKRRKRTKYVRQAGQSGAEKGRHGGRGIGVFANGANEFLVAKEVTLSSQLPVPLPRPPRPADTERGTMTVG